MTRVVAMSVTIICLGLVGLLIVVDLALLTMRVPGTAAGRAWRIWGVTSASTALVSGVTGVLVLLLVDRGQPEAVAGALVYGTLLVIPGALVGALVGAVLWLDVYRREMWAR
jgi:hypothetical protein